MSMSAAPVAAGDPGVAASSKRSSGSIAFTVKTSTGYVACEDWNAAVTIYGAGNPASNINVSMAVSGAGNRSFTFWSCPSNVSSDRGGDLTSIDMSSEAFTLTSFSRLTVNTFKELTYLNVQGSDVTTLSVHHSSKLVTLYVSVEPLSLDLTGCTALTTITVSNATYLPSLDFSPCTSLTTIAIEYCYSLTSITLNTAVQSLTLQQAFLESLDLTGCTALTALHCGEFDVPSIDASMCTALTSLICSDMTLSSLTLGACTLSSVYVWNCGNLTTISASGCSISDTSAQLYSNGFTADGLNSFFSDLAAGTGTLLVYSNPGSGTCDPSIATAKGYTVDTTA